MKLRVILLTFIAVALTLGAAGCSSAPAPELDETAIRAYADPATETTMQGLSEGDLEKYTQYGNQQFKDAVTQGLLDQVGAQIEAQLGTYLSKEFLSAEEAEGYIVVHYRATYTDGEVGVRMVFDDKHLVAGQFFE
jgi:hypothetical protein